MIKLKITSTAMKGLVRYLQGCINIARAEISKGAEFQTYRVEKNLAVREVPWLQADRDKYALRISERHAQISEFEKCQRKLLLSYDSKKEGKLKTVSISKTAGYFILCYMEKYSSMNKRDNLVSTVLITQSNIILKNLL